MFSTPGSEDWPKAETHEGIGRKRTMKLEKQTAGNHNS
jgi:hypothetical protein